MRFLPSIRITADEALALLPNTQDSGELSKSIASVHWEIQPEPRKRPTAAPNANTMYSISLHNRYRFLHVLNPVANILYETSSNSGLDSLSDEELWVLILVDVFKVKSI